MRRAGNCSQQICTEREGGGGRGCGTVNQHHHVPPHLQQNKRAQGFDFHWTVICMPNPTQQAQPPPLEVQPR
jgi:hypothetical protein